MGIISSIFNYLAAYAHDQSMYSMTEMTNAANAAMVKDQNAAAAAESEKARAYDSAQAQVSRFRSAGMSKAGALSALTGAGTYTPAPVNVSQNQVPQLRGAHFDFSGVANALQGIAEYKMQEKQLAEQKRQFDEQLKLERDKFAEEQLNNVSARNLTAAQIEHLAKQNDVSDAQIRKLIADTDLTWQELQNKIAEHGLTIQQTAKLVEESNLTTAQILQVKEQTKLIREQQDLVHEQALKTWKERGLTEAQTQKAWKEFEKLDNEVNQYLDDLAHGKYVDEREIIRLNKEILELAHDTNVDTAEFEHQMHLLKMSKPAEPLVAIKFFLDHVNPLGGLVKIAK